MDVGASTSRGSGSGQSDGTDGDMSGGTSIGTSIGASGGASGGARGVSGGDETSSDLRKPEPPAPPTLDLADERLLLGHTDWITELAMVDEATGGAETSGAEWSRVERTPAKWTPAKRTRSAGGSRWRMVRRAQVWWMAMHELFLALVGPGLVGPGLVVGRGLVVGPGLVVDMEAARCSAPPRATTQPESGRSRREAPTEAACTCYADIRDGSRR